MSSPLQICLFTNRVPILPCSGLLSPISLDVRTSLSQLRKGFVVGAITSVLDSFPFDPLKSKTLVIVSQPESSLSCDRNVCASGEIGDSRPEHGSIGTPFVNKKIWSGDDNFSVQSDAGKADKINTAVQRSSTDERNKAPT